MQNKKKFIIYFFFLLFSWLLQNISYAADIALMDARLSQNGDDTRIVFEFNKPFEYDTFSLSSPNRFVLDLTNTALQADIRNLPLQNTFVNDLREDSYNANTLRIVFDLKENVQASSFVLNPTSDDKNYRLVVDLVATAAMVSSANKSAAVTKQTETHTKLAENTDTTTASDSTLTHAITEDNVLTSGLGRNIIVVIDPGHGGKDPGATGPLGIHEKDVVLAIAKDIQNDIDGIPGMTSKLTRSGDYFITLRDRLNIAREDHADFFVAIHADAFINRDATGASVFALSQRGATSEAARWLAEKENYSELGDVDLADKSEVLRSVLIDLSQTATITQSLDIGQTVVDDLAKITPLHSRHVEQARFVVLKSPDIPSLLVETGFITNPQEETMLSSPYYQNKMAAAIAAGVHEYFWEFPPPDTLFALEKTANKYVVNSSDTLASIAARHRATTSVLMAMNSLRSSHVYPGEVLMVPNLTE